MKITSSKVRKGGHDKRREQFHSTSFPPRRPGDLPSGGRHPTDCRGHCPENRQQDLRGGRQRSVRQNRLQAAQTGTGEFPLSHSLTHSLPELGWTLSRFDTAPRVWSPPPPAPFFTTCVCVDHRKPSGHTGVPGGRSPSGPHFQKRQK